MSFIYFKHFERKIELGNVLYYWHECYGLANGINSFRISFMTKLKEICKCVFFVLITWSLSITINKSIEMEMKEK